MSGSTIITYNFGSVVKTTYATVTIRDVTITGGIAAAHGGGVNNWGGDLSIKNSTITNNFAGQLGGGISSAWSGSLTLKNVTVSNNGVEVTGASSGGGVFIGYGHVANINNSVVRDNAACLNGGGIANRGQLSIYNSTIKNNRVGLGMDPCNVGDVHVYGGGIDNIQLPLSTDKIN